MTIDPRYARHIALFGAEGQHRLASMTASIVGLGGLGAHVASQLAYLGITRFLLIDPDDVSTSNLNRLVGAIEGDVGKRKIDVASAMISGIQPTARVASAYRDVTAAGDAVELGDVDVVFGCVDNDSARLEIVTLASARGLPYVDLASDVRREGEFGGRIVFAKDGERCLSCLDELDQHELARAQMSEQQRAADDAIYGVDREALDAGGPSVISVNGVVASLAVTEFLVWVTGIREPKGYLNYRGDRGTVGVRADPPRGYCYYCMTLWRSRR
jgi:molybdopterin-synthase adenylyltransferase